MQKSANNNSKSHIPRFVSSRSTSKDRKRLMEENNEKPERQELQDLEINNDVLNDGVKMLVNYKNSSKVDLKKRVEDLRKELKTLEDNTAALYNTRETEIKEICGTTRDVGEKRSVPSSRSSSVERGTRKSPTKRRKIVTPNSKSLKIRENQVKNNKLQENSKKINQKKDAEVLKKCNEISQSINVITKSCNNFRKEFVLSSDNVSSLSDLDSRSNTDMTSETDDVILQNNSETPQDMLQNEQQYTTQGENVQETILLKQESSQLENNKVTKLKDISTRDMNYEKENNVTCHQNTTAFSLLDMETTIFDTTSSNIKNEDKINDTVELQQKLIKSDSGISSIASVNNENDECHKMDIETNVLETSIISYTGTPAINKTFIGEKSSDVKNNAFYVLNIDYLRNGSPSFDSDTTKVDMEISDNEDDVKPKKIIPFTSSSDQDSNDENVELLEEMFAKFLNDVEKKIKLIKLHGLKNIKKNIDISNKEEEIIKETDESEKQVKEIVEEQVVEVLASLDEKHVERENEDRESETSGTIVVASESGDVEIAPSKTVNVLSTSMRSTSKSRVTNNVDTGTLGLGLVTAGGVAAALYNTYKYWDQVAPLATSLSRYLILSPSSSRL